MNIKPGQTYRNKLGVTMIIKYHAITGGLNVVGDLWLAESPDTFFGPENYIVTEQGLEGAGYTLTEVTR